MSNPGLSRRDVMKWSGAATLALGSGLPLFGNGKETGVWTRPPEAATLYSKEYGRKRIARVQAAMKRAGLDALVIANRCLDYIGYVSNFHPYPLEPGAVLLLADGPSFVYVNTYSSAHTRALQAIVWVDELIDVPHDPVSEGSTLNLLNAVILELQKRNLQRGKIGFAGDEIDWILPFFFHDRLPNAHLEDANRTLTEVIVVKDDVEISLIRFAQRYIDEIAYPTFRETMRAGEIDQTVYARVLGNMLERGASPATVLLFDAGPAGSGTWASGTRGRRLERSDVILSEPTPAMDGYQAEKMFTFALSRDIPESQKRGSQVMFEAYQLLMQELKPGRSLTPIVEKVDAFIRKGGYPGATVPVGHWIGTQNHEGPRFTREGTKDWVLQPRMVMSWHPNVVIPGEVRTTCSTCVLITDTGIEDLSAVKMEPIYYL